MRIRASKKAMSPWATWLRKRNAEVILIVESDFAGVVLHHKQFVDLKGNPLTL